MRLRQRPSLQEGTVPHFEIDEALLFVFMLAAFLGFQLIKRVSPLLHSPLMSLTNAISAIAVVGAITITGEEGASAFSQILGFLAITASTINLVGGYLITDRMLKMFKKREPQT
jgi:NAD(P) transhydrogenase subunit alpha